MTEHEQIAALSNDLDSLLDRYRAEFDLATASAIGVLTVAIHELVQEAYIDRLDEDDDEEPMPF